MFMFLKVAIKYSNFRHGAVIPAKARIQEMFRSIDSGSSLSYGRNDRFNCRLIAKTCFPTDLMPTDLLGKANLKEAKNG